MPSRRVQRPDPPPLETDDVAVVGFGTALWAVALLVLLVLKAVGVDGVRDWWLVMCACGAVLGLYGVYYCRRRHAAIQRDRAAGIPRRT